MLKNCNGYNTPDSNRDILMNHATTTLLTATLALLVANSSLAAARKGSNVFISTDGSLSASNLYNAESSSTNPYVFAPVKGFTPLIISNPDLDLLPMLPDSEDASVGAISADGFTIIGQNEGQAVVWRNNTVSLIAPAFSGGTRIRSFAEHLSSDATVVVGSLNGYYDDSDHYFTYAFRWTESGAVFLPSLNEDDDTYAYTMTPDAGTIVGISTDSEDSRAVYWRGTTVTDIHPADIDGGSYAEYVSDDGNVIAVQGYDEERYLSFRWTQEGGTKRLGNPYESYTQAISASGDVFVGEARFAIEQSGYHAFRWTEAGGLQDIHPASLLADAQYSSADFVSRDGTKIFGQIRNDEKQVAFRWTSGGVIDIGSLGGNRTRINAITPDGRVAVGQSGSGPDSNSGGFRWTELDGMQSIQAWLAASGVTLGDDIVIHSAESVSDDGSIVSGYLTDENFYIAKGDSGLITLPDLQESIAGTTAAISSTRTSASLVLNGAHGHPMSRRAETGRFLAWAGGDYGQDNHGERDGSLSVAEAGGGYNFGPAQLNLALGRTDSEQDTPFNGDTDHTGVFGIVDVIIPVPSTPLYVTVTGIYQDSKLDIRRGYLNGGAPDSSEGDTDATTYGGALRVDWLNAASLAGVDITPFTKLVVTRSKIDAFTETGGGFPAAYQTQRDTISDLHLGANASYELRKNVRLIATLEGVYRFQDHASSTGVSVPGVTLGFTSLAGEDYKQFWLSGGLGAEYDVGAGTFSVMLNGTTEGAASNLWLATSYQYKF